MGKHVNEFEKLLVDLIKDTMLPKGLDMLAAEIKKELPAFLNPILASKYGTHYTFNQANGFSIDYS